MQFPRPMGTNPRLRVPSFSKRNYFQANTKPIQFQQLPTKSETMLRKANAVMRREINHHQAISEFSTDCICGRITANPTFCYLQYTKKTRFNYFTNILKNFVCTQHIYRNDKVSKRVVRQQVLARLKVSVPHKPSVGGFGVIQG